jgi:hypothetical protein
MPDAPDARERIGRAWVASPVLAVIVAAIGISLWLSPRPDRARRRGAPAGPDGGAAAAAAARPRKPIDAVIREIEQGDEAHRAQAIGLTRVELTPAELAQVLPHLIRAMKDKSGTIRSVAASVVGNLGRPFPGDARAAGEALTALLDDPSPALRAQAVTSLKAVAASGALDTPPARLVACLDDDDERVRACTVEALIEYPKGPELIVPVALRRIPSESSGSRRGGGAFRAVFWHIRLEPSILPLLIEGLSSENTGACLCCTAAINHMGRNARPALPAILKLIRRELDSPHPGDDRTDPDILAMAAGAIGELTPDAAPPPGAVELLCDVVKRSSGAGQKSDPGRPPSTNPSAKARESALDFQLAEAVWSLGILGRAAAPAVPLLLSTFESIPEGATLRGLTAEALAEIVRGTPDEDSVLASLAKAWKTAPKDQKPAMARALRRLGPKSEQLVPELTQLAPDKTGSQIRPVRYPRSRHGFPVRE